MIDKQVDSVFRFDTNRFKTLFEVCTLVRQEKVHLDQPCQMFSKNFVKWNKSKTDILLLHFIDKKQKAEKYFDLAISHGLNI